MKVRYDEAYAAERSPKLLASPPSVIDVDPLFGAPHGKRREAYARERIALAEAGGYQEFQKRRRLGSGGDAAVIRDLVAVARTPTEVKDIVLDGPSEDHMWPQGGFTV